MKPLPKISPEKYNPPDPRAAKIRFRIKGSTTEGNLYQGQHLVKKCSNCGNR